MTHEAISSPLPDLSSYADEELDALAAEVEVIREARRVHRTIPGVVSSLAQQYEAGGGDRAQLVDAVNTLPEPDVEPVPSEA